ncbi:hypothetical protein [Candidatus Halobonum tyrrellensis]|uniref:hypothetical protein n=1 Tax=Candidatus Halobonum tyrrellensis TaxID=1431545 RepID=UPI001268D465|nr:hypothetical protein [Candidatus Halobonum tyrrellensis]
MLDIDLVEKLRDDIEVNPTLKDVGFGGFILSGILILLYFHLRDDFLSWFNALGSLALTSLLAILYWRQSEIQKDQQDFQRELERPVLHVDGFRQGSQENSVKIRISNSGNSAARNVQLETIIGFSEKTGDFDEYSSGKNMQPLTLIDIEDVGWTNKTNAHIISGSQREVVESSPLGFKWYDKSVEKSKYNTFSNLHNHLHLDEDEVRVIGNIVYEGPSNTYRTEVFDSLVYIQNDDLLESLVETNPFTMVLKSPFIVDDQKNRKCSRN